MTSEVRLLVEHMTGAVEEKRAGVSLWRGTLFGRDCVVARTGMGKVSAASATQHLIDRFDARPLVVCGLAGGIGAGLVVGDVVVGRACVQHDMDASPIVPRFVVPGLGLREFLAPPELVTSAVASAEAFLRGPLFGALGTDLLNEFAIDEPKVVAGLIATGDQFIDLDRRPDLLAALPEALCVEMEGAAIAQVCHINGVPFVIIRTISDQADAKAAIDFGRFVQAVAPHYTVGIVRELFARL